MLKLVSHSIYWIRHPLSSAFFLPSFQGSFIWGDSNAPQKNDRFARAVKRREAQYADLTSRVTFVGRCTFHEIARVHSYSVPRSTLHTRTGTARGGFRGRSRRERGNSRGVHCGGYRSLINGRSLYSPRSESIKKSTSALHFLPPFLLNTIALPLSQNGLSIAGILESLCRTEEVGPFS